MSDLANQGQEMDFDAQLPGADGTPPDATGTGTPPDTQTGEEEYFEVTYNKEPVKVKKSEAPTYIQKGMNYDKVKGRAETLENALQRAARLTGYESVDEYLRAVDEAEKQAETKRYEDAGITDPRLIEEIIDRHPVVQEAKKMTAQQHKAALKELPLFNELEADIDRLTAANPKVSPEMAYDYLAGQLLRSGKLSELLAQTKSKAEQETAQKLARNAQTSPGALGEGAEHTAKSVSKMSRSDFLKLQEEVLRGERKTL